MNEVLIDVKHLCCKSGKRYLLKDIDWTVNKGEHWAVFGLNGCGKTTLLSIIAGFRKYTSGKIELFGEAISAENILDNRKKIGLDDSINENDVKTVKSMLKEIGLENKCNMPFNTLSKGERQNILLVRAMFSNPEILILDEPCSGLDIVARERVLQTVRSIISKNDTTVIYVTHYAEELLNDFSHVMLLKKGKVFAQGYTSDCLKSDSMSAFLDIPVVVGRDAQKRLQIQFVSEGGDDK